MPKSVVTELRPQGGQTDPGDQDGQVGVTIPSGRPMLRLARRHRLSRARGVVLGVLIGLVVWALVAVLFTMRL